MTLESLGWNDYWNSQFLPFRQERLIPARVCVEHKELYHFFSQQEDGVARVAGRLRHSAMGRADFPAVGDWVAIEPGLSGGPGVIHAILTRKNRFSRKTSGETVDEQIVAANLDTLFLITSLNRDLNPRRIERYLAAAAAQSFRPVIILTKSDICDNADMVTSEIKNRFPHLAVHAISSVTGAGLAAIAGYLGVGQTVAMVGSSGAGKSTLVNRLMGEDRQEVREIRSDDDRGRHATTHREMFALPQGGLLIDNPGMRELQLWDENADVEGAFADIAALAATCRFADCSHHHEPACAVQQALAAGKLDSSHFDNFLKMQRELEYLQARQDPQIERERKEKWKRIHRQYNKQQRRRERR